MPSWHSRRAHVGGGACVARAAQVTCIAPGARRSTTNIRPEAGDLVVLRRRAGLTHAGLAVQVGATVGVGLAASTIGAAAGLDRSQPDTFTLDVRIGRAMGSSPSLDSMSSRGTCLDSTFRRKTHSCISCEHVSRLAEARVRHIRWVTGGAQRGAIRAHPTVARLRRRAIAVATAWPAWAFMADAVRAARKTHAALVRSRSASIPFAYARLAR